jgi:O-antigen chain-terminating methyltransferase
MHNSAQRRIDQIESYSLALRTHLQDQTRAELDASIAQEVKRVDARLHHVNTRLNPLVLLDVGQRLMKLEQLNIARKMQNFDSLLANRSANPEAYPLQNKGNAEASPNQNSKFDEDAFFRDFETTFRGSEAAIQERLKAYLPYLENMAKLQPQERPIFVDVGCGRGEWLSLMAEQGIPAIGIDLNAEKVAACLAQGHAARVADAIVYLNEQAENSLGGVTGFHIIEHLPFEKLIALFDAALRALRPGGLIIFETPNPENLIVGACDFYYDPTHLHPIVPNVAKFIATQRGFSETEIVRLNPFGEEYHLADNSPAAHSINQYLFGARDYALIARK